MEIMELMLLAVAHMLLQYPEDVTRALLTKIVKRDIMDQMAREDTYQIYVHGNHVLIQSMCQRVNNGVTTDIMIRKPDNLYLARAKDGMI